MEFNEIIKDQVAPILFSYGFEITKEYKDYIRFESDNLQIITAYDSLEKGFDLLLGRKGQMAIFIYGEITTRFFPNDRLNFIHNEDRLGNFVHNLKVIFNGDGKSLLEGDLSMMLEIEAFSRQKTRAYNDEMTHRQNLKSADQAWEKQDYATFLKYLDILNVDTLPGSYKLKQNIARKKLNNQ